MEEGFSNLNFDLPKHQSNVIKVIGVGGGGGNAINHMFREGINGVDFVLCNTDRQALANSPVPIKIQLGVSLTEGLGAGANPEIGEQAALESLTDIKAFLEENTKMIFITAGMGGGTGTGAAPIIANLARELGILTVGIVTTPFKFEGNMRTVQAQKGIETLRKSVDSLIVINNNKLRDIYGNLGFKTGFAKADEVLATAAKGIAEVITHHYVQNIDLRDAKTVLSNSGSAIMGSATASGATRAHEAIAKALDSPLLDDNKINGAKNVLLLIVSGAQEITLDEIGEINDFIQQEAGYNADIIMGVGEDENLGESICVTVIATGFNAEHQQLLTNTIQEPITHVLDDLEEPKAIAEPTVEHELVAEITKEDMELTEQQELREIEVVKHELVEADTNVHEIEVHLKEDAIVGEEPIDTKPAEESKKEVKQFEGYIPTTFFIKEIDVVYEEVVTQEIEEKQSVDFGNLIETTDLIREIEVNAFEEVKVEVTSMTQTELSFDLNDSQEDEEAITFDFDIDATELPQTSKNHSDSSDYQSFEKALTTAKAGDETQMNYKKIDIEESESVITGFTSKDAPPELQLKEVNPYDQSIEDTMKSLAENKDRRIAVFKNFNHKFNASNKKLEELENIPAFKRAGVELEDPDLDAKLSRSSIGEDANEDLQIRSNNSFLHDNVD
ncbi:MAG: cell division protein FtsZ [Flavobacteriaceae bacterium]|nr:cell division protein FtsZ [Flavobacteriaceae bacterium]OUX39747.1 MAG: cell division protein FtsZ [Flavobacteriaceae bacterium TMED265]